MDAMGDLIVEVDEYTVAVLLTCGDYTDPISNRSSAFDDIDEVHECQMHGERQFAIPLQQELYLQRLGPLET